MKRSVLTTIIFGLLLMLNFALVFGQIVDFKKKHPYKKVFVETDNFGASYLDILSESLPKVKDDPIYFSMLNDLAYYWHTRNLTTAMNYTKEGLRQTTIKNNTLWNGRFKITQGAILLRMEKLDSAYIVLDDAKSKVKEGDLAFLNTQLGYVYERKGQLGRAADYVLESLRLGEKLNDKKAIALAYSDLSNLFWKQSKFEKGLEYGLKSLAIFEERNLNDLDYDFTLYVVGNNYLALKKYQKALDFFTNSIAMGERYGFYNNLSDVYISMVDLYAYLNNFEEAKLAGENAIKYAQLLDNNFMLMRSWLSVGKFQNLQGKYSLAIKSLQKCITIATKDFGDDFFLSQAYEGLGRAYAGNHNYQAAYDAFHKYDQLKNNIFTAEADQRISRLQTELGVSEKEKTIQLQNIKLKKQKSEQILIIIFTSLLMLLLILLYMSYQNNREKNKQLEKQNKEKEFLLKEIHHRVKNNLGIVSSLLTLQAADLTDPSIVDVMQESENRIFSMSMIHQRLYQGNNIAAVEMKDYFVHLGNHILELFGVEDRVQIEYNMTSIDFDVDTAVPLGLIVNELLTNALKYAFPNQRKGIIKITLQIVKNDVYELTVADNGKSTIDNTFNKGTGFGTQLIKLLIQQLDGKVKPSSNDGTSFSFEFKILSSI